jgi:co-chaperonin GroES (HSP10)
MKKRKNGWYRIKYDGIWSFGKWWTNLWFTVEPSGDIYLDEHMDEIDENIIEPNPKTINMKTKKDNFTLTPELNRVIILPIPKKEQKTKHGILIPATANDKQDQPRATLVALGKEYTGIAKVGDTVIYSDTAGYKATENGVHYLIVYQQDLLAICS